MNEEMIKKNAELILNNAKDINNVTKLLKEFVIRLRKLEEEVYEKKK